MMFSTRHIAGVALILRLASPAVAGGDVPTAAVTANPTLTYAADHVLGYAVESGNTYPALCFVDNTFTSVSGTIAACAPTTGTLGPFAYQFCSGSSLYLAQVDTRAGSASTSLVSLSCQKPCSSVTIYDSYPSATPTFEMGICGNGDEAAGVAQNLPPDVKVIYRHIPSSAVANTGSASASSSSPSSGGQGGDESHASSNKTPVIVGSVIGGVAGIGLIAGAIFLAFYCGRRRSLRRSAANPAPTYQGNGGKVELDTQNIHRSELHSVPAALPELQSEHTHELPAASQYPSEMASDAGATRRHMQ